MGSSIGGEVPEEIKAKGMTIDLRAYPDGKKNKGYRDYDLLYPSPTNFAMFTRGSLCIRGYSLFVRLCRLEKRMKTIIGVRKSFWLTR